jgi:hypothetical protein
MTVRGTATLTVVLAASLLAVTPPIASAQDKADQPAPAQDKPGHALCWRGKPECGSFVITEMGALYRLDDYPFQGDPSRIYLTFDAGFMKNLSKRHAVGLTGYALAGGDISRLGIRPRYRRWLSHNSSVDISPGILVSGEDPGIDYDPPGFVFGVSMNEGDLVALTLETEYARYREYVDTGVTGNTTYQDRSDWTIRGGAKLGSALGLAGTAALFALFIYVASTGSFD